MLRLQFDPDFQTPLILDEALDFSDPEESQFFDVFSGGLLAKSEPVLSMSGFQKPQQAVVLGEFHLQVHHLQRAAIGSQSSVAARK